MGLDLSYSLADQEFSHTKSLGVWNVSTQLLGHLARDPQIEKLTVFTNHTQTNLPTFGAKATFQQHNAAVSHRWGRGWGRVWWDQWGVYSAAKRSGNAWLFLPKGYSPIYRKCPVRLAAYVHDAMHDHYRTHSQAYNHNPLSREAGYFLRSLRATLREAEVIFTNTDFTRSEVLRLADQWNLPAPNVLTAGVGFEVQHHGIKGDDQRQRIVVLAGPWPHKCTPLAVERLRRWVKDRSFKAGVDWIGALPPHVSLPQQDGWQHHVRLSPHDYEKVLQRAAVVVYFSAYEGFGMPPVEGTLAGAAAVYSAIPAMTEVMGDCGFRFANDSHDEFARAMDAALKVHPDQLAVWQAQLAARHNWPAVARRIVTGLNALEAESPSHAVLRRTAGVAKKTLVFAHTPPPHHGQSYMVRLMLDGFGGDQRRSGAQLPVLGGVACYHVNARLSRHLEDIGVPRVGKLFVLLGYCLQAIGCRFRYGVKTFYYVPAPGKRAALMRDWLVMLMCRPFYPQLILHWHAAGLAEWLDAQSGPLTGRLTRWLLGRPELSIVLSEFNRADATHLDSQHIAVVNNGIPDPCPEFERTVRPSRQARFIVRHKLLTGGQPTPEELAQAGAEADTYRILYLAHATRDKGLFDCVEGVRRAAEKLSSRTPAMRLQLTVAGAFLSAHERAEFDGLLAQPGLAGLVRSAGFVSGEQKAGLLGQSDLFCFPTFYANENQPVNLIEAMAWGLPVVTTRWRSVPEMLPADDVGLVAPQAPEEIAEAILRLMDSASGEALRHRFEAHYTLSKHLENLATSFRSVGREP